MQDDLGHCGCQAGWHRIADLPGDLGLAAAEGEVVREAHQAGGLAVSDGPVLFRVEVAALFGLEEFGADGDGGAVPPQAAEQVGAAGSLADPTGGGERRCVALEVEAVAAGRDRPVTLEAHLGWVTAEMEIERSLYVAGFGALWFRQVGNDVLHRYPRLEAGAGLLGMGGGGYADDGGAGLPTDDDGALAGLRSAEVGGIEDFAGDGEAQTLGMGLDAFQVLLGGKQSGHVLDDENLGAGFLHHVHVWLPEGAAAVALTLLVEQAEALAGRPADDHVGLGDGMVLDQRLDVAAIGMVAEIADVGIHRGLVVVVGPDGFEAAAEALIDEAQGHSPGTGE